ncbi:MAG: nicotinate-nucleotide adenylyltransferase [Syntrophaceae bacterium]
MKWGLLGGTFDPIHFGHLRSGQEVLEMLGLDRIMVIPSYIPPFKSHLKLTPFEHRLNMARIAAGPNPRFTVSDIESREGISYSVDTVRRLKEMHGKVLEPYFIMGQDAFRDITGWKDWEDLLGSCNFVITTRPGCECGCPETALPPGFAANFVYDESADGFKGPSGYSLYFRKISFLDISSTDIRERRGRGLSIRYLLPDRVIRYIEENGLYS